MGGGSGHPAGAGYVRTEQLVSVPHDCVACGGRVGHGDGCVYRGVAVAAGVVGSGVSRSGGQRAPGGRQNVCAGGAAGVVQGARAAPAAGAGVVIVGRRRRARRGCGASCGSGAGEHLRRASRQRDGERVGG
eukprot:ctg_351.g178